MSKYSYSNIILNKLHKLNFINIYGYLMQKWQNDYFKNLKILYSNEFDCILYMGQINSDKHILYFYYWIQLYRNKEPSTRPSYNVYQITNQKVTSNWLDLIIQKHKHIFEVSLFSTSLVNTLQCCKHSTKCVD